MVSATPDVPLIPPAFEDGRLSLQSTESDRHDLPFLLPLSHAHPLLSSSNPNWDVDNFLLSRLHVPLDELRTDLRAYLADLKEELVQLINEDYKEFISLGTGLRGEGKRLDLVRGPIEVLKKDVEIIRSSLVSNEQIVQQKLDERSALREEKNLLQILLSLTDSLTRAETLLMIDQADSSEPSSSKTASSSDRPILSKLDTTSTALSTIKPSQAATSGGEKLIARVADEYTRVLYLADKARREGCAILDEVQWRIERIRNTLHKDLDHLFSDTLFSMSSRSSHYSTSSSSLHHTLQACLKTYDLISGWRDAEDLLRRELVRPLVRRIIVSSNLEMLLDPPIPATPFASLPTNLDGPSRKSFGLSPSIRSSLELGPQTPSTPTSFVIPPTPFKDPSQLESSSHAEINPFDLATPHASLSPSAVISPTDGTLRATVGSNKVYMNDSSPLGKMFDQLLNAIEKECTLVLEGAEKLRGGRGGAKIRDNQALLDGRIGDDRLALMNVNGQDGEEFEFFGNVVWKEIGERLMDELGTKLFAAGRPEELHLHYTQTHAFFTWLESLAPSIQSVLAMRDHPTYKAFEKRWQLPVYFQLRWKEIVGKLEEGMKPSGEPDGKDQDGFFLPQSLAVFRAIDRCWADEIFIPELSHRFWRLTLQILSRYRTWLNKVVLETTTSNSTEKSSGTTSDNTSSTLDPALVAQEDSKLRKASLIIADIRRLETKVSTLWRDQIQPRFEGTELRSEDEDEEIDLQVVLENSLSTLSAYVSPLSGQIIQILTRRCTEPLRLVRGVASQYLGVSDKRKPKEPSFFVPSIMKPVRTYFSNGQAEATLKTEFGQEWTGAVFEEIAAGYASVLQAAQKAEESLRKYRKGRKSTFSLFGSGNSATNAADEAKDEENIKLQMMLDVEGLGKDAEDLGVDVKSYPREFSSLEIAKESRNKELVIMPGTPHPHYCTAPPQLFSPPTPSSSLSSVLPTASASPPPSPAPSLPPSRPPVMTHRSSSFSSCQQSSTPTHITPPQSQPMTTVSVGPSNPNSALTNGAPSSSSSSSFSSGAPAVIVPPAPVAAGLKGMAAAAAASKAHLLPAAQHLNGTEILVADPLGEGIPAGGEADSDHPLSAGKLEERGYHSFMCLGRPFHVEKRWKLVRELGQGAYGLVISAQDDISGETIAIKMITRVFDKVILARRVLREITLLRHFAAHENITGLIDLDIVHPGFNEVYMFMEPMEADLHQIIRSGQQLSSAHVQYFMYQLFRGMKYVHSANVLHRDIKPGNVLVNADCELKICDFGLARGFHPGTKDSPAHGGSPLTEYVATRWYRAPEIMLSYRRYTTAIDVWSIGCILAELLSGKPIFKGKDYVDQLNLILSVLGTPDDETLNRVGSEKACKYIRSLPIVPAVPLMKLFPHAEPDAVDMLSKLLVFDPARRMHVTEALSHPYLSAYHDESDEPSCPAVFDKWAEVEALEEIADFRTSIEREVMEFRAEVRAVDELDPPWEEGVGVDEPGVGLISGDEGEGQPVKGSAYIRGALANGMLSNEGESEGGERLQDGGTDGTADGYTEDKDTEEVVFPEGRIPIDSNAGAEQFPASSPPSPTTVPMSSSCPSHLAEIHANSPLLAMSPSTSFHPLAQEVQPAASTAANSQFQPHTYHHRSRSSLSRRPSQGFFDSVSRRPNSLIFTPSQSPDQSSHPSPSSQLSSEIVRPPRSRHHSTSGDSLFRPFLRSLSTVSITDAAGLGFPLGGFSKISPAPPISPVPPLRVSPSDAPASELPLEFRTPGSRDQLL
ncbi:cog complex component [Phaffia rhodozyma]|uniref:Mitogen-activated protein kinase n=1 Tax=Phaffia rhodozyma TaxID=264483 RepID=A0A0F7SIF7_PHARH|nr:cog complex component [Phaffia rhodozyma]